jgi:hypothetical protein
VDRSAQPRSTTRIRRSLSGSLKVKWSPPFGQKFASSKSVIGISSVLGAADASFTIPGTSGTGFVSGSFRGTDAGATFSAGRI